MALCLGRCTREAAFRPSTMYMGSLRPRLGEILVGVRRCNSTNTVAPQTNPAGPCAHQLWLELVGCVRTLARETSSNGMSSSTRNIIHSNVFLTRARVLRSFPRRVANGAHTLPFSFSLPPDLPPSVEVSLHFLFPKQSLPLTVLAVRRSIDFPRAAEWNL